MHASALRPEGERSRAEPCACRARLEERGRACAAVQRRRLGVAAARRRRLPTDEQRQWQALAIAPLSSGGATGMRDGADRGGRADRVRAQARRRSRAGRGRCSRSRQLLRPARCASAAASATGFTGRCARPALRRRSRRNILPRWRPRSTSATSRPATASTWCSGATANLLYAGLNRAGEREPAARALERERPQRMDRRRQRRAARRRSKAG